MTRSRTDTPPIRAGDWVQVTYVVQARFDDTLPVAEGVGAHPALVAALGAQIQVFDDEPAPGQLKTDRALVRRAVDAELALADARARLSTAETHRQELRDRLAELSRSQRRDTETYRTLLRVEHARRLLVTALLDYVDTFGTRTVEQTRLFADAIDNPCPAYNGVTSDDEEESPAGRGAPCVRVHRHEGQHADVEGNRFDAPPLFDYVNPYAQQEGTPA